MKLFEHIPHHVCVCSCHENVRLLLMALKDHTALVPDFRRFINQIMCNSECKKCMMRECEKCTSLIDVFAPNNQADILKYQLWQKNSERIEKVEVMATVGDAFNELTSQLCYFLIHTYVKRKQATRFSYLTSQSSD